MMDFYTARGLLLQKMSSLQPRIQSTALSGCLHRYLAQDIFAQYNSPMFSNSAMDGYALCFADDVFPETFQIVGRIAAGQTTESMSLQIGQAIQIFTGAPIPDNCIAVVAQEHTEVEGSLLRCHHAIKSGSNVRVMGEEFKQGQVLLKKGTPLTPAALGVAASQGYAQLPIHAPLSVTVFSSGDELLEPNQPLEHQKIYDANRYQLIAWLTQIGCHVTDGGILRDDLDETVNQLESAAQNCDIIITSGGASVGEADLLKAAIRQLGTLTHWKLAIKPGKPFAWGHIDHTTVMMLPGNPVATFVTFKMLVEPALKTRMGANIPTTVSDVYYAHADFAWHTAGDRREFLRGQFWQTPEGELRVRALEHQGSHMLSACAYANCLIEIAADLVFEPHRLLPIYPL